MTRAQTRLIALLGRPVAHSRSPAMHTAALAALSVDADYLAFDVPASALGDAARGLRALGAIGANVTVPHKQSILQHLDEVWPAALRIGAVNTIAVEGGRLCGTNTDARGMVRALKERDYDPSGKRALVLGAGGAARAAVVGLIDAGARSVTVAARRSQAAHALVVQLRPLAPPGATIDAADMRDISRGGFCGAIDLLVQATSATMTDDAEAFAASLPLAALPAHATVMDLVYAPLQTTVLRDAEALGLTAVDGLGMLVWQAALALELWLKRTEPLPPQVIARMRHAARGGSAE